jgi:CRISPR/Cas system-associated exonuclease Cas4 (RecB family)
MDELTKDLQKHEEGIKEEPLSSLAAFVKAIGAILSEESIEQKTELSGDNIEGIMQALTINDHLETNCGFRIRELDVFILEKLVKTVSYNRKGKDELIELFRAMKLNIEGEEKEGERLPPLVISRR